MIRHTCITRTCLSFLVLSPLSYEAVHAYENVFKDGFYVGTEGKYVSSGIDVTSEGEKQSVRGHAGAIGIYGGYKFTFYKRLYLMPEVEISYIPLSINKKWTDDRWQNYHYTLKYTYHRNWMIEPRLRLGFAINHYMPYLFVGPTVSHESFSSEIKRKPRAGEYDKSKRSSDSLWRLGLKLGLGMEFALANNVSARFEGAYLTHRKEDVKLKLNMNTENTPTKIRDDFQFSAGLAYHF